MAIEDFEWAGNAELTQPSRARLAAGATSGADGGWSERARRSVWLEPMLKLGGMGLLLCVLAGIGVVATTYAKPGVKLPEGSRVLTDALGTSWLKPSPAASEPSRAPSGAPASAPAPLLATSKPTAAGAREPEASATEAPALPAEAPSGHEGQPGITPDGKVILNQASVEELTKLPGVGMKRAAAIVALRTKLKRFKRPAELLRVKGIGPRGLQKMLPHLVLDAPATS